MTKPAGLSKVVPSVLFPGAAQLTVTVSLVVVVLPVPLTTIEKADNFAVDCPSVALMMMLLKVPDLSGVPFNSPVAVLSVAHEGLF
jgi:hypothetical protein